jgi:hypothetical protein
MDKEQLIKPRYKVIADYPNSEWKIGEIIQMESFGYLPMQLRDDPIESWLTDFIDRGRKGNAMYPDWAFEPYPHLFKKLEWWEERELPQMPEYLKHGENGNVRKVVKWLFQYNHIIVEFEGGRQRILKDKWIPCNEKEYLEFQKVNI